MAIKIKEKASGVVGELIEELAKLRTANNGYSAMGFEPLFHALLFCFEFDPNIDPTDRRRLLRSALMKQPKVMSFKSVKNCLESEMSGFYRQPVIEYSLVTSVSIPFSKIIKPGNVAGCVLSFVPKRPIKFDMSPIEGKVKQHLLAALPSNYCSLVVSTRGRSEAEAVERALRSIDRWRGLWNFFLTKDCRTLQPTPSPLSKIALGPLHTLHQADRPLTPDANFWYELDYRSPIPLCPIVPNYPKLKKLETSFNRRIKFLFYSEHLNSCLVQYVRALDQRQPDLCLLKLWAVLEQLTFSMHKPYDITINRIARLYKNPKVIQGELKYIGDCRNQLVHRDKSNLSTSTLTYRLKTHVDTLLMFHLDNRFKLRTEEDVVNFLDTTADANMLKSQIAQFRRDISLRNKAISFA